MDIPREPVPNPAEAQAVFDKMMRQLHVAVKGLSRDAERAEMERIIVSLQEAVQSFGPALKQSEDEIEAMRRKSKELLHGVAESAAPPKPEEASVLGPRLRQEVLQRYGQRPPAPATTTADDDRMPADAGSVASQWAETEEASETPSKSLVKNPAPAAQTMRAEKPKKGPDADAWDDLSKAEE